jgi:hypothetical protein
VVIINKSMRMIRLRTTIFDRLGRAVTFSIRVSLTGYPVVPNGSSDSLRGVNCNILYRQVRIW